MKINRTIRILFCAYGISFSSLALAGCGPINREVSAVERRQYVDSHPDLGEQARLLILNGYIELGMSQEEILASRGSPVKKIIEDAGPFDEVWIYRPHWKFLDRLYFENGILVKTVPEYLVHSRSQGHGYRGFDIKD